MTTIGNIGIGLFILLLLWIGTLIIFVIGVKLQSNVSWIALGSAALITIILLVIPTDKISLQEEIDVIEKDYSIIYKHLLLVFILISGLGGFISFFVFHCLESIYPKPAKSFGDL